MEEITPYVSSVSKRGQTVVPMKLRQFLAVHEGDHLIWEIQKNQVTIKRLVTSPCPPEQDLVLSGKEWLKLDEIIDEQDKKGEYTRYPSLRSAKRHLRNLGHGG